MQALSQEDRKAFQLFEEIVYYFSEINCFSFEHCIAQIVVIFDYLQITHFCVFSVFVNSVI